MNPGQLLVFRVDLANVAIMRLLRNVVCRDAVLEHVYEAPRDVAALAFGLGGHAAALRRTGIGAEPAEEVRKARHCQAEFSGRRTTRPVMPQVLLAAARAV